MKKLEHFFSIKLKTHKIITIANSYLRACKLIHCDKPKWQNRTHSILRLLELQEKCNYLYCIFNNLSLSLSLFSLIGLLAISQIVSKKMSKPFHEYTDPIMYVPYNGILRQLYQISIFPRERKKKKKKLFRPFNGFLWTVLGERRKGKDMFY